MKKKENVIGLVCDIALLHSGESNAISIIDIASYLSMNGYSVKPRAVRRAIHHLRINGEKVNGKTVLIPICLSKNGVFIAATEEECLHAGRWFAKREREHALARQAFTADSLAAFKDAINNPMLSL